MPRTKSDGVSLSHVQQSMNGNSSPLDFNPPIDHHVLSGSKIQEESEPEWVIFKLKNGSKNKVLLDGTADILDQKTKKVRRARLLNGVQSLWLDEQKDVDPNYARLNRRSIEFIKRVAKIHVTDEVALEFMRSHFGNEEVSSQGGYSKYHSNYKFFEYNINKIAEEAEKRSRLEFEAFQLAVTVDEPTMRKHAIYLNIKLGDEFGFKKDPKTIRYEYGQFAKTYPELFLETIKSEVIDANFMVRTAIQNGFISINNGSAYFSQGGSLICSLGGDNPVKALCDLYLRKTPDSESFKNQLKELVKIPS